MRRLALWIPLVLLTGCGQDVHIAGTRDLSLRVTPGTREIQSGAPFPLTVVRTWKKPLVPRDVDPTRFAPLVLTLESSARREDAARIEETLHYRAYAFARADIVVPAQRLAAGPPEGGVERVVSAPAFRLRVSPALDEQEPGPPEMPGPPLVKASDSPWPYLLGALLLVALGAFLLVRRRPVDVAPPAPVEPPPPPPPAGPRALAALEALRARVAAGEVPSDSLLFETSEVLRQYVCARGGAAVDAKTSREVLALATEVFGGPRRAAPLQRVLATEELAKFARQPAPADALSPLLEDAIQFVRDTQGQDGGGA